MKRIAFVLTSLTVIFFSCEDSGIDEMEVQSVGSLDITSEETITSAMEDADVISDAGFDSFSDAGGRGIRDEILDCAAVTHDTVNNVITIDYGEGCEGPRGRIRSGKIIVTYSGGRRFAVGAFREVTFEGFVIDSTQIEGTRTHRVTSVDTTSSTITTEIALEGGKVTFGDGTTATREASRTRVWNRTENTTTVNGSARGVNREGVAYTMDIVEELVFARDCWFGRVFVPISGVKVFTTADQEVTIDYGDGECDNIATVTNGSETEEIVLSLRGRRRG